MKFLHQVAQREQKISPTFSLEAPDMPLGRQDEEQEEGRKGSKETSRIY